MYDLPYHKEKDPQVIKEFVDKYPFAFLTGCDAENKPVATQVPVFIEEQDGRKILRGHIMKNTDHHKVFLHNNNVLVVFTGHHTYVSGTWYTGNPQQASTWNYIAIHARGQIKFLDETSLIELLKKLSLHFENNNTESSTVYDNLPLDYKEKLIKAILAFEIEVTEMENVHKLSQNRDEKSYDNIVQQLKKQEGDGNEIGNLMEKRKDQVFK